MFNIILCFCPHIDNRGSYNSPWWVLDSLFSVGTCQLKFSNFQFLPLWNTPIFSEVSSGLIKLNCCKYYWTNILQFYPSILLTLNTHIFTSLLFIYCQNQSILCKVLPIWKPMLLWFFCLIQCPFWLEYFDTIWTRNNPYQTWSIEFLNWLKLFYDLRTSPNLNLLKYFYFYFSKRCKVWSYWKAT